MKFTAKISTVKCSFRTIAVCENLSYAIQLKQIDTILYYNYYYRLLSCTILTYVHNYVNIVTVDYLTCLVKFVMIYSFFQYYQLF